MAFWILGLSIDHLFTTIGAGDTTDSILSSIHFGVQHMHGVAMVETVGIDGIEHSGEIVGEEVSVLQDLIM